jgi:hypothetical protein
VKGSAVITRLFLIGLVVASSASSVLAAADTAKKREPTAQQLRMKNCNGEAKTQALKGEPRKRFMSDCLKGKPAAASR